MEVPPGVSLVLSRVSDLGQLKCSVTLRYSFDVTHYLSLLVCEGALQELEICSRLRRLLAFLNTIFLVDFQVQNILKRLETPFS